MIRFNRLGSVTTSLIFINNLENLLNLNIDQLYNLKFPSISYYLSTFYSDLPIF